MSRAEDLTGRVFGSLTVLRRGEDHVTPKGHKSPRWLCYCSKYKHEVLVHARSLKNGNTTSGKGNAPHDLTGQKFGSLTVLRRGEDYVSPKGHKRTRWVCWCSETNRKVLVHAASLKSGETTSGRGDDLKLEDLTGQRFGTLTVLRKGDYSNTGKVRWWCWCSEYKRKVLVLASSLKSGNTTNGGGRGHGAPGGYNLTRAERGDFDGKSAFLYLAELESPNGVFHKVGISRNPAERRKVIKSKAQCTAVRFLDFVKAPLSKCVQAEKLLLDVAATEPSWASLGLPRFDGHTECRRFSRPVLEDARSVFRSFVKEGVAHHAVQ